MPYSAQHRAKTKSDIIAAASKMFNQYGYEGVTIDQIMARAGLSRGGFYHHFKNKEALFTAAVRHSIFQPDPEATPAGGAAIKGFLAGYVSKHHLDNTEDQCPMMSLSGDVARAGPEAREAYRAVLTAMSDFFETHLAEEPAQNRQTALVLCALSVGGMILARTVGESELADEIVAATATAPERLGVG